MEGAATGATSWFSAQSSRIRSASYWGDPLHAPVFHGQTPQAILTIDDLERGIKIIHFYLGQIQDAMRLIAEEEYSPPEISERSLLLAQTLKHLRPHLQNGRLAIGFIHEQYNMMATETQRIGKPRGMGAVLRAMNLTISDGKHDANGHRGAKCLVWDSSTEIFIEKCLHRRQNQDWQEVEAAGGDEAEGTVDIPDVGERVSASGTFGSSGPQDNADIADGVTDAKGFTPSPDWQEVPEGTTIPPGADIRMDLATGKNYARWPHSSDTDDFFNRSSAISDPGNARDFKEVEI